MDKIYKRLKKKINKQYLKVCNKFGINPIWGYPNILVVEPTNLCNLNCPLCVTGKNMNSKSGMMNFDLFKQSVDIVQNYIEEVFLWLQGEPLLHKNITEMIAYISSKKIKTTISTNGQLINEKMAEQLVLNGLNKIYIAIDGANQETYEKYRVGGSYEKAITAIKLINKFKDQYNVKNPKVYIQFLVTGHNEHQISEMESLAKDLNVTLKKRAIVVTHMPTDKKTANSFLPKDRRNSRYDENMQIRSFEKSGCHYPWEWAVVNWDGAISACGKDPLRTHVIDYITEEYTLLDIWRSEKFNQFRKQLKHNKEQMEVCKTCAPPINAKHHKYVLKK